ncbi:MAG: hypothetical protein QM696_04900 [Steroidobacteraceae bacterium]
MEEAQAIPAFVGVDTALAEAGDLLPAHHPRHVAGRNLQQRRKQGCIDHDAVIPDFNLHRRASGVDHPQRNIKIYYR